MKEIAIELEQFAKNEKELTEYAKMLDRRSNGIVTRKARAIVYFENYYKQDFAGVEEEI